MNDLIARIDRMIANAKTEAEWLDGLTIKHTAFPNFRDMVESHPGYRPTICCDRPQLTALADAYDRAQQARGDDRRAYRYREESPAAVFQPPRLRPGQRKRYFRNQADRWADVLAVVGDKALIVYEMPSGVEYMNFVAADGSDEAGKYQAVSIKGLSAKWRSAIKDQHGSLTLAPTRNGYGELNYECVVP